MSERAAEDPRRYLPRRGYAPAPDADVAELADRLAIEEVIRRYGHALDERDVDLIVSCFSDDVQLDYMDGRFTMRGIEQARAFFEERPGPSVLGLTDILGTTHVLTSTRIELGAEGTARATTFAVAFLHGAFGDEEGVVQRGLRYVDRLARLADGWRITERFHTADWNYSWSQPRRTGERLPSER